MNIKSKFAIYFIICEILIIQPVFANPCKEIFNPENSSKQIPALNSKKKNPKRKPPTNNNPTKLSKDEEIALREKYLTGIYSKISIKKAGLFSKLEDIVDIYPTLPIEDQQDLFILYKKSKNKDEHIRTILHFSNLKLFFVIMKKKYPFIRRQQLENWQDYFQESNMALLDAIEDFDPYRGWRFSTYATTAIQNRISKYRSKTQNLVPLRLDSYRYYRELLPLLYEEKDKNPNEFGQVKWLNNFIADHPEYKSRIIKEAVEKLMYFVVSLNDLATKEEGGNLEFIDLVESKENVLKEAMLSNEQDFIAEFKEDLLPIEIMIWNRMLQENSHTLEDIGNKFNMTSQAINEKEIKLREKLLKFLLSKQILDNNIVEKMEMTSLEMIIWNHGLVGNSHVGGIGEEFNIPVKLIKRTKKNLINRFFKEF